MGEYRKEILILIVSTFLLSLFIGSLSKKRIKYAYPIDERYKNQNAAEG